MDKYEILKKYFGYDGFRPGQEELIDAILSGRDALGIMPTGAGKSVCYQVPALLLPGITIVISPLISLMKDQVRALNEAGVHAAYINSSLTETQIRRAMELACEGRYKIIYVAPERLQTPLFLHLTERVQISMVTVDEAHCISQWGQDFRPSYLNIVELVSRLPARPVVSAFTATATEEVRQDILCVLGLREPKVLVTGFDRENLYFEVRTGGKDAELLRYVKEHREESGIIYCATRKNVEAVCTALQMEDVPATRYHAGLSAEERRRNQDQFLFDEKPVMVATNAFGMGIDKSNVRYVIHYNMPQSMENYYQEAGRAGRDGARAECILLYSAQDVRINQFLLDEKEIREELTREEAQALRERDAQRLKRMTFYGTTKDCLRAYILNYFGERAPRRCENCSNCLHEFVEEDVTELCRDVVRCIRSMRRGYGAGTVASVLHGSGNAKLKSCGLDRLDCFGSQSGTAEFRIREVIGELLAEGYLAATPDKYALLSLTGSSGELLERQTIMKFSMPKEKKAAASGRRGKGAASELDSAAWQLFERLKALRLRIAGEQKVPPYIVFTDKTLIDMCVRRPASRSEMLAVSGVGEAKFERYGERFLEEIGR
ncbi:MAG: DNA helicase RecQ [Eubacteriales bacterium]|nr:DNA helicase RecQ [Eubacteriales bacterium]